MIYRELDIEKIIQAINLLSLRINDRFPVAGLLNVCNELKALACLTKNNIVRVNKPYFFSESHFLF